MSAKQETKCTPTPWELLRVGAIDSVEVYQLASHGRAGIQLRYVESEEGKANAEFIVRAVNMHEALLKAAKRGIMALEANGAPNCEAVKELKAAISMGQGNI